jgi:hypothetical protein
VWWSAPVIPAVLGGKNRRILVQASSGIKQHLIFKITSAERAGGVAQVVKCLSSKCKALSSTHILEKKKSKEEWYFVTYKS